MKTHPMNRRDLLRAGSTLAGGCALSAAVPAWAKDIQPRGQPQGAKRAPDVLTGPNIELTVAETHWPFDGRMGHAVTVNGTIPGPMIRLKEGENVRIAVTNHLKEDTSIHWHGLLLPFQFDGVPGVSFPGIKPGETFVYEFPIIQSGTYWYHSHSGLQEPQGHYGSLVIDPAHPDPVGYDREYVIVLSDYSFLHPHTVMKRLKQQPGYFNHQKQTLAGLLAGKDQPLKERIEWAAMRMDPTDISDVTGSTYTFLMNGHGPEDNWTALFNPGERVRLRFINAAAMTIYNVRIPGLPLTVVQADGENVKPVETDEFQITLAETYDVIVTPKDDRAFTIVAEAVDRSGAARGTLAPRIGMTAPVPPLRARPLADMRDMGMDMSSMEGMPADSMDMSMRNPANAPQVKMNPSVQMIAPMAIDRTGERGQGLKDVDHRVLVYTDLVALTANPDTRAPTRTKEIHLTGNMERFMWSLDGEKFSEVKAPIPFRRNERVRIVLVNDTMMAHPIHLHGHFFEVVNGHDGFHPRKHTVNVAPGGRVAFDLTADAPGDWAFHCHLFHHMHAGMMNVVTVRPMDGGGL